MMILLFLLLANPYKWIAPNGFISFESPVPIKEHSGFICRNEQFEHINGGEWMYDRDNEKFIKKPALVVSFKNDTLRILATNTKEKTRIEITEKYSAGILPKNLRSKVIEASSIGVIVTKQVYDCEISVINELCYPMRIRVK